jgi:hypothetical protein
MRGTQQSLDQSPQNVRSSIDDKSPVRHNIDGSPTAQTSLQNTQQIVQQPK